MKRITSLLAFALLVLATPLGAQMVLTPDPAPAASDWKSEFLMVFDAAADKYVKLAEAIPAEKYTWRPAAGVRSIAEVILHVSQANYGLINRVGGRPPAGLNVAGVEKSTTDKAAIVGHIKTSLANFRAAVVAMPDGDAERMVDFFGPPKITVRHFLTWSADHNGEHLGQLIAYARMNGVVPPWSQ